VRETEHSPAQNQLDDGWRIAINGFHPLQERAAESLHALGNGYIGSRASLPEGNPASSPGTFVAGVFDSVSPTGTITEIARAPDCLCLQITIAGETIVMDLGDVLDHQRQLDLWRGIWTRHWRHCDKTGRITVLHFTHFFSLADQHALLQRLEITPENYTADITVEALIDGRHTFQSDGHSGLLLSDQGAPRRVARPDSQQKKHSHPALALRMQSSGISMAFASAMILEPTPVTEPLTFQRDAVVGHVWSWQAQYGRTYHMDRLVSVYTSRDCAAPEVAVQTHIDHLVKVGRDRVLAAHEQAWSQRWGSAGIELEGDEPIAKALHLAAYHLISSANAEDEHVSIGARGLTGQAYGGHVFWDTEIFMLPFFLCTNPPAARALLMYRFHTLPAARAKARRMGYRGALYAWESADSGEEATPAELTLPGGEVRPVLCGEMEHHISADVAYAVWRYWCATGDDDFFIQAGAEILLETARFWASRAAAGEGDSFRIRGVIGPDEYHEDVDDNAYTNLMARWNLIHGQKTAEMLARHWPSDWRELSERLGIETGEVEGWQNIARGLVVLLEDESGIIEQFEGYHALEEIDLASLGPRTIPADMILGQQGIGRTKVIKQADVLMALSLLWNEFPKRIHEANFHHYEPRTAHGSSLSPGVHALFAARLGELGRAERYLRQTAAIDLDDQMANAAGGVHMAALGSLWQAVVVGFAGVELLDDRLAVCPSLAPRWRRLGIPLCWRGRRIYLDLHSSPRSSEIALVSGPPLLAATDGQVTSRLATADPIRVEKLGQRWELIEEAEK
jgi:kojibiose phosphorylase